MLFHVTEETILRIFRIFFKIKLVLALKFSGIVLSFCENDYNNE